MFEKLPVPVQALTFVAIMTASLSLMAILPGIELPKMALTGAISGLLFYALYFVRWRKPPHR